MSHDYILQPFAPPVQLQIDYARELNEQQHAAVTAPPGPALVIAGAVVPKNATTSKAAQRDLGVTQFFDYGSSIASSRRLPTAR